MNISATLVPASDPESRNQMPPKRPLAIVLDHVRQNPILWLGFLAFAVPTMLAIARQSWSTEQGAHGPIVLATGIWLIGRQMTAARAAARPGSGLVTALLMIPLLALYALARITDVIEVEGFAMYGIAVTMLYALCGPVVVRLLWFPLVYLLFIFPPPDTAVAAITQPLKIWISEAAVNLLHFVGYPIAGSGVSIQIGQYELLVAMACAGLNSIISLSAICLFYIYIRHNANWRYALLLMLVILPVAVLANFVRVLILVLLTYHMGDAAAQGFLHDFAGILMFAVAVLGIFGIDALLSPLRRRLDREGAAA